MKTKLAWIPFVPLFLAAGFLKLAQGFMPDGGLMGLSSLQLDYCYIGACVLIFLFTLLFVLLDKKIPVLTGLKKVSPDEVMLKPELIEKRFRKN